MCAEIGKKIVFGVLKIKPPPENTLARVKKYRISTKLLKKKNRDKKTSASVSPG
jgi:hypothetical protein